MRRLRIGSGGRGLSGGIGFDGYAGFLGFGNALDFVGGNACISTPVLLVWCVRCIFGRRIDYGQGLPQRQIISLCP